MARRHLQGYRVKPSIGSMKGQRWGSASGHSIKNEGEVLFVPSGWTHGKSVGGGDKSCKNIVDDH